jgi:hypothetical protein
MLRGGDRDGVYVLESGASLGARLGCGCFSLGGLLMLPLFLLVAFLPPREVTIDCDRARGNCTWKARTVPLGDLEGAEAVKDQRGGRSMRVYTVSLVAKLKDKQRDTICTAPSGDDAVPGLENDVVALEAFITDASVPKLQLKCFEDIQTTGERIYYPIMSVVLAAFGVAGLRIIGRRKLEIDAKARKIRLHGSLGSGVRRLEVAPEELQGVELNAGMLMLQRKNGPPVTVAVARPGDSNEPLAEAKSRLEALLRGESRPQ